MKCSTYHTASSVSSALLLLLAGAVIVTSLSAVAHVLQHRADTPLARAVLATMRAGEAIGGRRLLECVIAQCHSTAALAHGYVVDVGAAVSQDWHARFLFAAGLSPAAVWLAADDALCMTRAVARAGGWAASMPIRGFNPRLPPVKQLRSSGAAGGDEIAPEDDDKSVALAAGGGGGAGGGQLQSDRPGAAAAELPIPRVSAAALRIAWDDDDAVLGDLPQWLAPARTLQVGGLQ